MKTHFDHLLGYIPDLMTRRILDLGSGRGAFLIDVAKRGVSVWGIEPYQKYIDITLERAKEAGLSVNVKLGTAERLPFADASFDFVNICEVIEHVEDPKKLLFEVQRVLAPGGFAYLSIPNRFGLYDPHFHLYFINWMPRAWAHAVIGFIGKHKDYSGHSGRQSLIAMHYMTYRNALREITQSGLAGSDMRMQKLRKCLPKPFYLLVMPLYLVARAFYLNSFHVMLKKEELSVLALAHNLKADSGWGRYSSKVAAHLKNNGLSVDVMEIGGSTSLISIMRNCLAVRNRARDYTIVHAFDGWPYGVYGYSAVLLTTKKLFISGIGTYSIPVGGLLKRFLMKAAYRRARAILCISAYTARRILLEAPNSTTKVVHMGLTQLYEPKQGVREKFFEKYAISQLHPLILTVGEIKNRKGQYDTLQAVNALKQMYPDIGYVMVGKSQDKEYRNKIDDYVGDKGLEDHVRIITDAYNDSDLASLYCAADVLALNSRNERNHFEGFGLVILEAAQFGVPSVGSRNCGIEDAIEDGKTGILVNQGDISGISEAIVRALSLDKEEVKKFASTFSWWDTVRSYICYYNM